MDVYEIKPILKIENGFLELTLIQGKHCKKAKTLLPTTSGGTSLVSFVDNNDGNVIFTDSLGNTFPLNMLDVVSSVINSSTDNVLIVNNGMLEVIPNASIEDLSGNTILKGFL